MNNYVSAIGAAALAVFTAYSAAAQTELPTRPDPAAQPTRPASAQPAAPVSAPYVAPAMPASYPTSALGLEFGWGAPYGWGIEYAHMVTPNVDLNAGFGIGVGAKVGIGARYFFRPERPLSPYLGANLSRTGGLSNVDVSFVHNQGTSGSYEEMANYSMTPSGVLHLRGGGRWQLGGIGLLGTLGYGVRLSGDPVSFDTFRYGQPSPEMRNLVQTISPGGLEISLGILFGLGR